MKSQYNNIRKIKKRVISILDKYFGNDYILFLFGSFAKNKIDNLSDFDLAIYSKNPIPASKIVKVKEELETKAGTLRFEYTFESLWKTIKEYLRTEGIIVSTPLQCFKEAFKAGLIDAQYEDLFLEMIDKRNQIVHIYGMEEAKKIYEFIKKDTVYSAIESIYKKLKELFSNKYRR